MRKIITSEMISADGFFAGLDGNIDWHIVDDEFNQYALDLMKSVDTILFGRITYQMFESYWPNELQNPETSKDDRHIAQWIDDQKKVVLSKTLYEDKWKNSTFISDNIQIEILKLKEQSGKDIVIYGSGSVVSELTKLNLIDEYNFIVAPVAIGNGRSLFENIGSKVNLKLTDTKKFKNGNMLLQYEKA